MNFFSWIPRFSNRTLCSSRGWFATLLLGLVSIPTYADEGQGPPAQSPYLVTVEGQRVTASLLAARPDGSLQFQIEEEKKEFNVDQIVRWGNLVDARRGPLVLTSDGSLLVASDPNILEGALELVDDRLRVKTILFGTLSLARDQVRAILFQLSVEALERDRLLERARRHSDATARFFLTNGDELRGTLLGLKDQVATIRTSVGEVSLPLERLQAVLMRSSESEANHQKDPNLRIGYADGSLLVTDHYKLNAAEQSLRLAGSRNRILATDQPVYLRSFSKSVAYLSDLEPAGYRHIPYLSLRWLYNEDLSVQGGRLRSGASIYEKGLGMHSAARITYRLDQPYRRLDAELAIDAVAGAKGSVVFRVFLLSDREWTEAYASPVVRGGMEPIPISVDLRGAKAMTLVIDFADRGDELDHANWLGARLVE